MPGLRPHRFLPTVLLILAAFLVVTQPQKAASAVNNLVAGIEKVADALSVFTNGLG